MRQQRSTIMERSFSLVLTIGMGLLPMTFADGAVAQVLDRRVEQLLANNCTGLLGAPANDVDSLTGNLKALCQFPNTGAASSAGGGAASVQGSAASILNRAVVQRLDQLTKEGSQEPKPPTSLLFNPIGLLSSGFGQYPSVSSPFYAATPGGGSTATFTSGSPTRWNGVGFFASGLVEALNRDVTTFQDGYKSTIWGITAGSDYRFSPSLVAGFAFNYANTDGDFRSGGNFSTNSYGGLLFASYLPTDKTFVQLTGGYTRNNYLVARLARASVAATGGQQNPPGAIENISGMASSQSTGNVFNLGFLTGYHHTVGRFTMGPRVGVYYSNTHINRFSETGSTGIELTYDAQRINSLQSMLGSGVIKF